MKSVGGLEIVNFFNARIIKFMEFRGNMVILKASCGVFVTFIVLLSVICEIPHVFLLFING